MNGNLFRGVTINEFNPEIRNAALFHPIPPVISRCADTVPKKHSVSESKRMSDTRDKKSLRGRVFK